MDGLLIEKLQNPGLYDHEVNAFKVLETHISWVILTGQYAYKIKKPVNFGFVDFSTLEKREHFCQKELELNQALAGNIYLKVIPISGSSDAPLFNDDSQPIEYAIQMNEFSQEQLLSNIIDDQVLKQTHWQQLAEQIAFFHQNTNTAKTDSPFVSIDAVTQPALDNFSTCYDLLPHENWREKIEHIEQWTHQTIRAHEKTFNDRAYHGFIRRCHGDIHLGNIALIGDFLTIFDCIDFNENFYWIDAINDLAFLLMDLKAANLFKISSLVLNRYLAVTGDYTGLSILKYYEIYRAMVRAKVALLCAAQFSDEKAKQQEIDKFEKYATLAYEFTHQSSPKIFLMNGVSGSGKSTVSLELMQEVPAIRLRSDVERKRLCHSIEPNILYSPEMTHKTYQSLLNNAKHILEQNYSVIIDAAFLKYQERELFYDLAKNMNIPCLVISCHATEETLKKRVTERLAAQNDPSDADVEVLSRQLEYQEPLTSAEKMITYTINTEEDIKYRELIDYSNQNLVT